MHSNEQQCDAPHNNVQFVRSILFSAPNPLLSTLPSPPSPVGLAFLHLPSNPLLRPFKLGRGTGPLPFFPLPHISFSPLSLSLGLCVFSPPSHSSPLELVVRAAFLLSVRSLLLDSHCPLSPSSSLTPSSVVCSLAHPLLYSPCLAQRSGAAARPADHFTCV